MRVLPAVLVALLGMMPTVEVAAQTGEPEYIGVIAAHNPGANEYVQLERVTLNSKLDIKALGFAGGRGLLAVSGGPKSPVRFSAGGPPEFVLRVERQDRDPMSFIQFFRLETSGRGRALVVSEVGGLFSARGESVLNKSAVPFTATKLGTDFYKFSASQPLALGEYIVTTEGANTPNFGFGVDP